MRRHPPRSTLFPYTTLFRSREIVAPERIVSTEKFEQEWYPGEAVGTLVLAEHEGKTTVTQTMQYDSRATRDAVRSEEHTSELQSRFDLVCRLLLEKKK